MIKTQKNKSDIKKLLEKINKNSLWNNYRITQQIWGLPFAVGSYSCFDDFCCGGVDLRYSPPVEDLGLTLVPLAENKVTHVFPVSTNLRKRVEIWKQKVNAKSIPPKKALFNTKLLCCILLTVEKQFGQDERVVVMLNSYVCIYLLMLVKPNLLKTSDRIWGIWVGWKNVGTLIN